MAHVRAWLASPATCIIVFHEWLCATWHTVLVDSLSLPPQICCSPHPPPRMGQCLQDSQNSMISSLQIREEQWRSSRDQKVDFIKSNRRNWRCLILRWEPNRKIHEDFLSKRYQPAESQDLVSIVPEYIIYIGEYLDLVFVFGVCVCVHVFIL